MERIVRTDVSENELDMNRGIVQVRTGRFRRLVNSLLSLPHGVYTIEKPRRSIDQEAQRYSPFYE